ncbi:MAG: hypothetical protein DWI28_02755 [Planctomycetota bacterium]|nr:MAG: hypothetical protein DWI28_02755 [Planctomycetota bacterium]
MKPFRTKSRMKSFLGTTRLAYSKAVRTQLIGMPILDGSISCLAIHPVVELLTLPAKRQTIPGKSPARKHPPRRTFPA